MRLVGSINNAASYVYYGTVDYCKDIPKNTPKAILEAFVTGALIETVCTGNLTKGAMAGGVSILATSIYALISPIFKMYIGQKRNLSWSEEMCRTITSIAGAGAIMAAFGNNSILKFLYIDAILYSLAAKNRADVDSTHRMCLFLTYPKI